jgi:hypothetical protein
MGGAPLHALSVAVVAKLRRLLPGHFPIVGVGGIVKPEDALRMRDAGADLIQLYTGLVYEGIGLPRRIRRCHAREVRAHYLKQWQRQLFWPTLSKPRREHDQHLGPHFRDHASGARGYMERMIRILQQLQGCARAEPVDARLQ